MHLNVHGIVPINQSLLTVNEERMNLFAYGTLMWTACCTKAWAKKTSNDWTPIADSKPWKPEQLKPEHLAGFCSEYTD